MITNRLTEIYPTKIRKLLKINFLILIFILNINTYNVSLIAKLYLTYLNITYGENILTEMAK